MEQSTIKDLIVKLSNEQNNVQMDILENLRIVMGNFNSRVELAKEVESINLEAIFQCLDTNNNEQIETTCNILKNLMNVIDPEDCLSKYHESMLSAYLHPSPNVRILVISFLGQYIKKSGDTASNVLTSEYQHLILATLKQIVCDELSVVKVANEFLINISKSKSGAEFLLGPAGVSILKEFISKTTVESTISFRIYDTLANISIISFENYQMIEKENLMLRPLKGIILNNKDPLGQMNALEILSTVAVSDWGFTELNSSDILNKIEELCQNWENDPMCALLFPGVIKFIGKLGLKNLPKKELIGLVFDSILKSGKDYPLITVGFEAVCSIGSTPNGKTYINNQNELRKSFQKIKILLVEAPTEYRARILEALTALMSIDLNNDISATILKLWFLQIFSEMSILFELLHQPFPDIRLSSLNLFGALTNFEWAQKLFFRIPGVFEFLMDRKSEPTKDCTLAKFKIIQSILENDTAKESIDPDILSRLEQHFREGPYFSAAQSAVAVEQG